MPEPVRSNPVRLVLYLAEKPVHSLPLLSSPIRIGRGPGNDLVIGETAVSAQHATVWADPGGVWVADFGSTNGTFLNERRIRGAERFGGSDHLRIGRFELRVEGAPDDSWATRAFAVEDVGSGLRFPLFSSHFFIGGGLSADLVIPGAEGRVATLLVEPGGDISLVRPHEEVALAIGESFEVEGRVLRVVVEAASVSRTDVAPDQLPYELEASLDGPTGAHAVITNVHTGARWRFETENRSVLLYLLARQVAEDRERGIEAAQVGWCANEAVVRGIWGRNKEGEVNKLHVLVFRLRKELEAAGFEHWFIEKRRRGIRIVLPHVQLA